MSTGSGIDRLAAALADRYRIERELGQGGMATVYLAHDLKHDRQVAIKVLKPELAAVLGAERFVVEIKTTAALQHPHILPLFDSGTADGFLYYVMPFIEGETLRAKLDRETQLGIDEAIRIAVNVADALDYAHRHGVIHRDIKPENILLHDGRPMVADFGIALALSAAAGGRMTETGMSLGTPHYMSPEQATAEKEVTGRSDVYSLASVLYEMLSGEPPHMGKSAQQIIMKIIAEPVKPVTDLRKSVPPHVADALAQALEKLPADRFASAAEFGRALTDAGRAPVRTAARHATGTGLRTTASGWSRDPRTWTLAALVVAAIAWASWPDPATQPRATAAVLPLDLRIPTDAPLNEIGSPIAIAPDGSFVVYVGPHPEREDTTLLWRRDLERLESVPIPGTENAQRPRITFDGRTVRFERRIPLTSAGGPQGVNLGTNAFWEVELDGSLPRRRQSIGVPLAGERVLELADSGIRITSAGQPEAPRPDSSSPGRVSGIRNFKTARVSPDLRWIAHSRPLAAVDSVVLRPADGGVPHAVAAGGSPEFLDNDLLAFRAPDGSLQVGRLSADRSRFEAPPQPVVPSVATAGDRAAIYALGGDGTLAYVAGNSVAQSRLVWVTSDGETPVPGAEWRVQDGVALSPDGTRAAVSVGSLFIVGRGDIWVTDLRQGTSSPLTSEGLSSRPVWRRDGRTVTFTLSPAGAVPGRTRFEVHDRAIDGAAPSVPLPGPWPEGQIGELAWSPDERHLVLRATTRPNSGRDLFYRRLDADSVVPFASEPAQERGPRVSPDGRWLLYVSDRTGRDEIYAEAFPGGGGRVQLSLDGGREPIWSRNGDRVFYRGSDGWMTEVRILPGADLRAGERRRLFDARPYLSNLYLTMYDVAPDGRFLMFRLAPQLDRTDVVLIRNWAQQVRARLAAESR